MRVIWPISARGWMVPISLFACITDTSTVAGVIAVAMSAESMRPSALAGMTVTWKPCLARCWQAARTALCSMAVVMTWLPAPRSAGRCR